MPTNDFLPFATAGGAGVLSQAEYAALAARPSGFVDGIAEPTEVNKVWRQAAFMAASVGQFVADYSGGNALDNGVVADLLAGLERASRRQFANAITSVSGTATAITATMATAILSYADVLNASFTIVMPNAASGGGTTFAVDGLAAQAVTWADGTPIEGNNWLAGERVRLVRAASSWVIPGISPAKVRAITAGTLRTVALTAASGTWTAPADVSVVNRVLAIGGGGSGGNSGTTASKASGAGGGGAWERFGVAVTPGGGNAFTVGAGGIVNPSGQGFNGNAGGSTAIFGTTGTGGAGGNGANNSVTAIQVANGTVSGTTPDITYPGGRGTEGTVGTGGGSIWAQPTQRAFTNAGVNNAALGFGGGGPGGSDFGGAWQPGGAGSGGVILLQYFSRFAP